MVLGIGGGCSVPSILRRWGFFTVPTPWAVVVGLLSIGGSAVLPLSLLCAADDSATNEPGGQTVVQRAVEAQMVRRYMDYFVVECPVEEVPVGSRVHIHLTVNNAVGVEFPFDRVTKGCQCADIKFDDNVIPVDAPWECDLSIEAPHNARELVRTIPIRLRRGEDKTTSVQILVRLHLSGILSFVERSYSIAVGGESKSGDERIDWEMPIVATPPIKLKRVVARGLGQWAEDLECRVVETPDGPRVRCELPLAAMTGTSVAGEVEIRDPVTGQRDSVLCVVQYQPDVVIAPNYLVFRLDGDARVATCMMRINNPDKRPDKRLADSSGISVSARFVDSAGNPVGRPLRCTVKELAQGIYRIRLEGKASDLRELAQSGDVARVVLQTRSEKFSRVDELRASMSQL
ncbi:MAG: hypothetical protein KatS3mg111_0573 [Pirellulaceae bacterium]|nr:MAG: hypothetical protein KatS3mg111_0573 [Pirellulaceae bacterium]